MFNNHATTDQVPWRASNVFLEMIRLVTFMVFNNFDLQRVRSIKRDVSFDVQTRSDICSGHIKDGFVEGNIVLYICPNFEINRIMCQLD